ncbi:glycosyltransferase [Mycobacterium sp. URHB0021]
MATILAYTSPALGHLLPMSALLSELSRRGHHIHARTLSTGMQVAQSLGFTADVIDPAIEEIGQDDWKASNPLGALKLSVSVFSRRAAHEVADLFDAVSRIRPDALLVDVNCWGALSAAEAGSIPWACFSPYTPPLSAAGVPPFGLGLKPLGGAVGRIRDAAARTVVVGSLERIMVPPINRIRTDVGAPPVGSIDEFLRRAPLMLVASGKPFQYPQGWGDAVQMIGPCVLEFDQNSVPDWLASIDRPIVLVTTSSERQADEALVLTTIEALADDPVHIVATVPTAKSDEVTTSGNTTVCRFVPHGAVLDRAVCAVTHGGMGATQKALAHGVPVCVVPFGRDQFEVARRAEVAGCGTRLPARRLSAKRLRAKVRDAMTMTDGAARVAEGFAATGGTDHGADVFEKRVLGIT